MPSPTLESKAASSQSKLKTTLHVQHQSRSSTLSKNREIAALSDIELLLTWIYFASTT